MSYLYVSFKSHVNHGFCASIQTRHFPTAADVAPPLPFKVCKGVGSQPCKEANDLKSCSSWERKKPFWTAASAAMADAMHQAKKDRIVVAVRKELTGNYSIFNFILYRTELLNMGVEMFQDREWNPSFKVYEIPVTEASDCKVAPWLKMKLKERARREVAMTCACALETSRLAARRGK